MSAQVAGKLCHTEMTSCRAAKLAVESAMDTCTSIRSTGRGAYIDVIGGDAGVPMPPPPPPAVLPACLEELGSGLAAAFADVPSYRPSKSKGVAAAGVQEIGAVLVAPAVAKKLHSGDTDASSESEGIAGWSSDEDESETDRVGSAAAVDGRPVVGPDPCPPAEPGDDDEASARRGFKRGAPLDCYKVFDDAGVHIGDLVWNKSSVSLDAHCHCKHGKCHCDRTIKASTRGRKNQGRPLGFLVAWLFLGNMCNADEHAKLKKGQGELVIFLRWRIASIFACESRQIRPGLIFSLVQR